jgi:hypothetical protein
MLHQRALTSNSTSSLLHLVSWSQGHQKSGFEVPLVADHLPALCLSLYELQLALSQKKPTYKIIQWQIHPKGLHSNVVYPAIR